MLKDITIGQYFPGESPIHKADPRAKIIFVTMYVVTLFLANNIPAMSANVVLLLFFFTLSKIPARLVIKGLKPIVSIIIFTSLLNMMFVDGNEIFRFWIFRITDKGLLFSFVMAVRVVCLIAGTSLLTYTTSPIALTDGIERLLWPFSKLGVPVHELAMMMTIAIRFIPNLIEETDKIMSAQKARGANMEGGSLMDRAKAMIPIMIPLFVSSFRRADELALAMECRCYRGGEGRTKMKQLKLTAVDFLGAVFMLACLGGVIYANIIFPSIY